MGKEYEGQADSIKDLFKGIWSLENLDKDFEVQEVIKKAIFNPQGYVIKPQKEGGGHNFYGQDVKEMLLRSQRDHSNLDEIRQYLIMERIYPPVVDAYMLKKGLLSGPVSTL